MEVFTTVDNVIIQNKEKKQSLWCNRSDGKLIPVQGCILPESWNPVCRGVAYGVIGKMQMFPDEDWKLLVIGDRHFVGYLPIGIEVYRITKVGVASLSVDNVDITDLNLQACGFHKSDGNHGDDGERTAQQKVQKTWNTIKSSANQFTEKTNHFLKEDDGEKVERRLFEELVKMFESGSFYYSPNGDLSNTRQRRAAFDDPFNWEQTDERFFWNKHMVEDLITIGDESASHWILPIVQGFIQIERCTIDLLEYLNSSMDSDSVDDVNSDDEDVLDGNAISTRYRTGEQLKEDEYDVVLISRRSRHRAGTRYNRRGVDEQGNVANYVETEQIVCVLTHTISHVQVRGSVPVYWSQPGVRYKPLPVIDRSFTETKDAFARHFDQELSIYGHQVLINLVDLSGREKPIADAYMEHIFVYNSENLTYITFDFHEYCRGMKFENVAILTNVVDHLMDQMGYFWTDVSGTIMEQSSVFRVNCMDCLDRTNVVQAAIARSVINNLLRRLGRLLPEETLPKSCRRMHNIMWANNGDAISRQYAGTAAMKGDFTRTGERRIAGLMKDGYNSANRYYLNRFKDIYRQTVIDMMLGNGVNKGLEDLVIPAKSNVAEDEWTSDREESIAQLVRHTEISLLPQKEECRGGWALVDPFTFMTDPQGEHGQDEDIILLLTWEAYYVARYSDVIEEIYSYQRIPIECLERIEIGMETCVGNQYVFMRLYHRHNNISGFFHSFKTIQQRSHEESRGILVSVADTFRTLFRLRQTTLKVLDVKQLDKTQTKPHQSMKTITSKRTLRTASKSDDVDVRPGNDSSQHVRLPLKPSLSLSDISSINGCEVDDDEESEFLRLHRQHSPKLKQEAYRRQQDQGSGHQRNGHALSNRSGITASYSEGAIDKCTTPEKSNTTDVPTTSSVSEEKTSPLKLDALFKKTKTALSQITPKIQSNVPLPQSDTEGGRGHVRGGGMFSFTPMKNTLQRMNDKFLHNSSGELKNPLKMFPNFRSKIQTALTVPKAKIRILTEEEKEKRMSCKTKIIEL